MNDRTRSLVGVWAFTAAAVLMLASAIPAFLSATWLGVLTVIVGVFLAVFAVVSAIRSKRSSGTNRD